MHTAIHPSADIPHQSGLPQTGHGIDFDTLRIIFTVYSLNPPVTDILHRRIPQRHQLDSLRAAPASLDTAEATSENARPQGTAFPIWRTMSVFVPEKR